MTKRAALYMRISDDQEGEQQATARQKDDCLAHAARKGWEVMGVFEDIDISAYRNVKRPAFEDMLTAVAEGRVDVVLAWKMDRLSRRLKDLVRLDEACDIAHATICTIVDGVDTATTAGKFVSELLVSQAKMESANTSTRVKRALAQHAAEGRPKLTGCRPYGYDSRMENTVPAEAEIVREAARRIVAGDTLHAIARDFNTRGLRTTGDRAWRTVALRRLFRAAYPSAQRELGGVLTPGNWPAIIKPEEHRRVRAILASRVTPRGRPATSPMAGLLKCGLCGHGLTHKATRRTSKRSYICSTQVGEPTCGRIAIRADALEAAIADAVLLTMEGVDLPAVPERGGAVDAVVAAEADMAGLAEDFYVLKAIGRAEFMAARAGLQANLDRARAEIARLPAGRKAVKRVDRAEWDGMDTDTRRAVALTLLERVEVHPAAKRGRSPFDPSRLRLVWRA
jgi:DNA invertase Pin-like site-specific DNA recombinase